MDSALWLFFATPEWFFDTLFNPLSLGELSLVPFIGILSLPIGVIFGLISRRKTLGLFLVSPLVSQALVVISGFFRGQVYDPEIWLYVFLFLQLSSAIWFIYWQKGARTSAIFLSIFALSYAEFSAFVSLMALTENWL